MKIAICEDSEQESNKLVNCINEYYNTYPSVYSIETFTSGEDLLKKFKKNSFNLILLDIYMNNLNGIETAENIRQLDGDCCIVFITSSLDFSLDAFRVQALDYIIKPISLESITKCLSRYSKLYGDSSKYIQLREYGIEKNIYISNILYIEVIGNYCYIYTEDEVYKIRSTLQKLCNNLKNLNNRIIAQCHKSFLINMEKVKQIEKEYVIMSNDKKINITRKFSSQFRKLFFDYVLSKN